MRYSVAIIILALSLVGCSGTYKDPTQDYQGQSAAQIYSTGEQSLASGNYTKATNAFEALDALYPFAGQAEQARLDVIYAYYKNNDPTSAVAAAERYIHLYPRSPKVDYAYYMRGITRFYQGNPFWARFLPVDPSQRELDNARLAFNDFAQLVKRFPHSEYTPDARKRMVYLREVLARHELLVAQFYYRHNAFVAAANRANNVILHYEHAPAIPDALVVLTESYKQLGLDKPAHDSFSVLQASFPDSPQLQEVLKNFPDMAA